MYCIVYMTFIVTFIIWAYSSWKSQQKAFSECSRFLQNGISFAKGNPFLTSTNLYFEEKSEEPFCNDNKFCGLMKGFPGLVLKHRLMENALEMDFLCIVKKIRWSFLLINWKDFCFFCLSANMSKNFQINPPKCGNFVVYQNKRTFLTKFRCSPFSVFFPNHIFF